MCYPCPFIICNPCLCALHCATLGCEECNRFAVKTGAVNPLQEQLASLFFPNAPRRPESPILLFSSFAAWDRGNDPGLSFSFNQERRANRNARSKMNLLVSLPASQEVKGSMTGHQFGYSLSAILTIVFLFASQAVLTADEPQPRGKIYLVGMGPGDAELVTIKAARVLKEADCVFCFGYLKEEVARFVRPEKITVGSPLLMGRFVGENVHSLPPELREQADASKAEMARFVPQFRKLLSAGKTVVFADAGDPTIFCPWFWIRETFADFKPEVVPGLSSFNAANTALKPTLTCTGGTILLSDGADLGRPDEHGRLRTTLVLFTHHLKVADLVPRLAARYPADTPIALVCEASYRTQEVLTGTLGNILEKLRGKKLPHLYLIYVGDNVVPVVSAD